MQSVAQTYKLPVQQQDVGMHVGIGMVHRNCSKQIAFLAHGGRTYDEIVPLLPKGMSVAGPDSRSFRPVYLDTFDRSIHRNSSTLFVDAQELVLGARASGAIEVAVPIGHVDLRAKALRTVDLPAKIAEKVAPLVGNRALLRTSISAVDLESYMVMNESGKILLVVESTSYTLEKTADARSSSEAVDEALVIVSCFRGYEEALCDAVDRFRAAGWLAEQIDLPRFLLQRNGTDPDWYASLSSVSFSSNESAAEATRRLMAALLRVLEANVPGVRNDIDMEFLHDFRVALRRTRSLMGEMKAALPPGSRERLLPLLKRATKSTNRLRDLDVLLEDQDRYESYVPDILHPEFKELYAGVRRERETVRSDLLEYLDGPDYAELVRVWRHLTADPWNLDELEQAARTRAAEIAHARMVRAYRKLEKRVDAAAEACTAESIHAVRIAGKKLRYLLELFGPLFDEGLMRSLSRHLKKVQNRLGDFNDLTQHEQILERYIRSFELGADSRSARDAVAALIVDRLSADIAMQQSALCESGFAMKTAKMWKQIQRLR